MLKRLVLVGLMTAFGVGGIATPSSATTGGSIDVCDSAFPNCSTFHFESAQLSSNNGGWAVYTPDCTTAGGSVPTQDSTCIYVEVDSPIPVP